MRKELVSIAGDLTVIAPDDLRQKAARIALGADIKVLDGDQSCKAALPCGRASERETKDRKTLIQTWIFWKN